LGEVKKKKRRKEREPARAEPAAHLAPPTMPLPAASAVCAAVAGLIAAWIAAGSLGLLAHSLRHSLTCIAMGVAVVAAWPTRGSWRQRVTILLAVAVAMAMTGSPLSPINVLGVGILLGALAWIHIGEARTLLTIATTAVAVLGLYRLAFSSIPLVWYLADTIGSAFGWLGGVLAFKRLRVGATYGGIDYLITLAVLLIACRRFMPTPRGKRLLIAIAAIVAAHLIYLIVLARVAPAVATAPPPVRDPNAIGPPDWSWPAALRTLVPWNLPAIAALLHGAIAVFILRSAAKDIPSTAASAPPPRSFPSRRAKLAIAIALLLPVLITLTFGSCNLKGKKIVFSEKGFLNWLKPRHGEYGRLGIGMYGMMPQYIQSLGARCVISPNLSAADLRDADAVVLMFPNEPWEAGQLERLWKYARDGGSLLVMGEHSSKEPDVPWERGGNRYNEALLPTSIQVAFDAAEFAVGGWLQSYQAMAHPANAGVGDYRNEFGVVIGASLTAHWPAAPTLIGIHGWNDLGDEKSDRAMLGNNQYDPGERLGDIILAAEQPIGRGRIMAFGDTSSLTNGITMGSHVFTSRLFAYLADQPGSPQASWRQILGAIAAGTLLVLLLGMTRPEMIVASAFALSLSTVICAAINERISRVIPDGGANTPNGLAYIDTSHLSAAAEESWRPEGTMGLAMTLLRDGYLTLTLPDFDLERIRRAGIVVTVSPNRPFSASERAAVREFVEDGGIFICTTGYDQRFGSESLMADFGFGFGERGDPRPPQPWGHFKSPYLDLGGSFAYVRFHAGWPIYCTDASARIISYGPGNTPVILMRRMGQGKFVMIGDSGFAMNKNLEHEGGEPFEGMRENADFWRWLLTVLTDQPAWMPTPATKPTTAATQATTRSATAPATQAITQPRQPEAAK
jgi:hypothetical protein